MGCQECALATQFATEMCNRVGSQALDTGLFSGRITALRHEGDVSRVHVKLCGKQDPPADHGPFPTPRRPVGVAEMQDIFLRLLGERLEPCVVRFGKIKYFVQRGMLREVAVTERFRITGEIPYLSRIFLPSFASMPSGCPMLSAIGNNQQPKPK